jgi:type II secretory pathway component PulC
MRRPAIAILISINVTLALLLAWLWFTPEGAIKNSAWTHPAAQKTDYTQMIPPLPGTAQVDTSKFVAMLDRPLFMLTRRPPPPPPPPDAPAPVDTLTTARISGVFSSNAGGGVIINLAGKDRRVRLNESIEGGWTLQSISGSTVTFTGAGQSRSLTLPRAALTSYSGLPVAAPPAALTKPAPSAQPPAAEAAAAAAAAGAQGGSLAGSSPAPRRATFGGSR